MTSSIAHILGDPNYSETEDQIDGSKSIINIIKKEPLKIAIAFENLRFLKSLKEFMNQSELLDDLKKLPKNIYEYFINLIKNMMKICITL